MTHSRTERREGRGKQATVLTPDGKITWSNNWNANTRPHVSAQARVPFTITEQRWSVEWIRIFQLACPFLRLLHPFRRRGRAGPGLCLDLLPRLGIKLALEQRLL